jgi:hypothetical protein
MMCYASDSNRTLLIHTHGKDKEKEKKLNEKEHKCKIKLPKKVGLDVFLCILNVTNKGQLHILIGW